MSSVNFLNSTIKSPMKKMLSLRGNDSPSSRRKRPPLENISSPSAKQFRLASRKSFYPHGSDKVTLVTVEKLLQEYAPLSGEAYMKAENSAPTPIVTEADAKFEINAAIEKTLVILARLQSSFLSNQNCNSSSLLSKGSDSEEKENVVKDTNESILDDLERLAKQHQRTIAANLSNLDPRSPAKDEHFVEISLNEESVLSPAAIYSPAAKKVFALRSRTERMIRQFGKSDQMIDARSLPADMRFDRDLALAAQLAFLCKKFLKLKGVIVDYSADDALDTLLEIKAFVDSFNKAIAEDGEFTAAIPEKLKTLWQIENSYQDENSDSDYKRGVLKVETKTLKKWKPRLVELDTNNMTLKVFKQEREEEEAKYEISVEDITGLQANDIQGTPFSPRKSHYGFSITIENFPRKSLAFTTKSKKEMIEWCLMIDEAHVNLTAVPLLGASYKENLLHMLHTRTY